MSYCVSCMFVIFKPYLVWFVNSLILLCVVLSLVSLIGDGDRCRECFELCLLLSFYRPIIGIPLCLHDLGLKTRVWLWPRHLRHLSFSYLHKLKPNLFSHVSDFDFQCKICELEKSHRISYFSNYNKNTTPFMTIHYDVWGPVEIPTLSSARYFVTFINECTCMTWIALL